MPPLPTPKLIDLKALEETFSFADGFQRADWTAIGEWIDTNVDPWDVERAWSEAALHWVTRLRDDLGGSYFVLHSHSTILLSDQPEGTAQWLLKYAGQAAGTVKDGLGTTAWNGASGKKVVLVFSEEDDYYQYVAHYLAEGKNPASGGMCIHSGYTHIAIPWRDELDAANAIVHELTHDCVAHLCLPVWLNEGLAMTLQRRIAPPPRSLGQSEQDVLYSASIDWRPPLMWDELAERHFAFWNEENIQSFWAGTSFDIPGDSNELSYSLAEVFMKLACERGDSETIQAFIEAARQEDSGHNAAIKHLGTDLGLIAGTFLGAGNWFPKRKAIMACLDSARLNKGD